MNAPSRSSTGSERPLLIARVWHGVAIRRFAGDDYEKAHYYPEDSDYLLDLEPFVLHYDVVSAP